MKNIIISLISVVLVSLTGCAYDQGIHTRNKVFNFGQELPEAMVKTNYVGVILEDEKHINFYTRGTRVAIHGQDASPDTWAEKHRIVPVRTVQYGSDTATYFGHGLWTTAALVPDGTPRLRKFDIVEFRNVATWRTLKDFPTTGEGNAVIKVLCSATDPNYQACLEATPKIGRYKGAGRANTEYKPHLKDYGFTFNGTPYPDL